MELHRLRRALGGLGMTSASALPAAVEGRTDEYRLVPSEVVEGTVVRAIAVGAPTACPEPIGFLDGVQRYELAAYVETSPIVYAEIAAAVRERRGRELRTVVTKRRALLLGRAGVLAAAGAEAGHAVRVPLEEEGPIHPLQELENARKAIDRARAELEREVGYEYRTGSDGWLVVDGSLWESEAWSHDPHTIGVSKSHATLPFEGEALSTYLRLPVGHRSSAFAPKSRRFTRVYAWGLRLWAWEGKDLLHGLVRVEAAAGDITLARADEISRWLMAERAPVSRPDPRWDRLLYGVASVERGLKAADR
ncbi:MAG: hypothetical protein ABI647_22110 [Gemmatimonadota bacterium]